MVKNTQFYRFLINFIRNLIDLISKWIDGIWNYIGINRFGLDYIKYNHFFQNIFFCTTLNYISVFLLYLAFFVDYFEPKKTRIEFFRRSVQFSARELRSETISCIFGSTISASIPKQPTLKMKSAGLAKSTRIIS